MSKGTRTGPVKKISPEDFSAEEIEQILAKYADLIAQMQTPEAMAAVDSLFTATPEEIADVVSRSAEWRKRTN